jgi:hypothetical protein
VLSELLQLRSSFRDPSASAEYDCRLSGPHHARTHSDLREFVQLLIRKVLMFPTDSDEHPVAEQEQNWIL